MLESDREVKLPALRCAAPPPVGLVSAALDCARLGDSSTSGFPGNAMLLTLRIIKPPALPLEIILRMRLSVRLRSCNLMRSSSLSSSSSPLSRADRPPLDRALPPTRTEFDDAEPRLKDGVASRIELDGAWPGLRRSLVDEGADFGSAFAARERRERLAEGGVLLGSGENGEVADEGESGCDSGTTTEPLRATVAGIMACKV